METETTQSTMETRETREKSQDSFTDYERELIERDFTIVASYDNRSSTFIPKNTPELQNFRSELERLRADATHEIQISVFGSTVRLWAKPQAVDAAVSDTAAIVENAVKKVEE